MCASQQTVVSKMLENDERLIERQNPNVWKRQWHNYSVGIHDQSKRCEMDGTFQIRVSTVYRSACPSQVMDIF
jgi:hypothetical protein